MLMQDADMQDEDMQDESCEIHLRNVFPVEVVDGVGVDFFSFVALLVVGIFLLLLDDDDTDIGDDRLDFILNESQ